MVRLPAVYIMANEPGGRLYTGVTSNLAGRVWQHKRRLVGRISRRHNLHLLVYFETADTMRAAIEREKQIKRVSRRRRVRLIENMNPEWKDLYRFVSD